MNDSTIHHSNESNAQEVVDYLRQKYPHAEIQISAHEIFGEPGVDDKPEVILDTYHEVLDIITIRHGKILRPVPDYLKSKT